MAFFSGAFAKYEEQDEPGLYLVYPQDERVRCTCEIFVIHGLHGGTTKTWKHPDTGNVWFRDLLPALIRHEAQGANARIWTYGYPANFAFQTQTIYDFAQALLNRVKDVRKGYENRKIIWICHSMGGVVLKQALIDAKIHARFNSIRDDTAGIIFLGTPHQGSGVANLGSIVASIVSSAMPGVRIFNREVLKDLKKNNNTLFGISSQFSNLCSGISIHSFHETMPLGPGLIVDRTSSVMLLENEVKRYGLNANHKDICRFRDGLDQNWLSVGSSIVELVSLTAAAPAPRTRDYPNVRRQTVNQPRRGLPYPEDPWQSQPAQPQMYSAFQMETMYVQQQQQQQQQQQRPQPQPQQQANIPRRPVSQATSSSMSFAQHSAQNMAAAATAPRDRPTYAPPQLPQGWVAQWDPETIKYFFVEVATGVVQWDPPPTVQRAHSDASTAETSSAAATPSPSTPNPQQSEYLGVPQPNHQRSASEGAAPARLPYPSVQAAYSREDLGTRYRSQSQEHPAATAAPSSQRNSPAASQASQFESRPPAQSSASSPAVPLQNPDPDDLAANLESARCDGCMGQVTCWQPRVQCTECYDYDLCIKCFRAGTESKGHKRTHKVSHIIKTQLIMPDDLVPVKEAANPEFNGEKANWRVKETATADGNVTCTRVINTYSNNSHARFLASAKPGHYAVSVVLTMEVSAELSEDGKNQIRQGGAGHLRLSLGTLRNKKEFFGTKMDGEDAFNSTTLSKDCIPPRLLNHYWWDVEALDIDKTVVHVQADALVTVDGEEGSLTDLGLILQWSGTRSFQSLNEPVLSFTVVHIRMDDILNYNEPHVRAPAPAAPKPVPSPQPTAAAPAPAPAAAEEEEEPEVTNEEALSVFLQLLREAQDAQQRELVRQQMMAQIQEEEEAKQEFLGQLFLQALGEVVAEQQERERQELERQRIAQQQQQQIEAANQIFVQAFQNAYAEQEMIRYLQSLGLR